MNKVGEWFRRVWRAATSPPKPVLEIPVVPAGAMEGNYIHESLA